MASQPVLHILYLSNFIESKGYKEVLELAAKVQTEQKSTLHFHFAGKFFEEKERMYFENFITKHQLKIPSPIMESFQVKRKMTY